MSEATTTYQWNSGFHHPIKHKGAARVAKELEAIKKANGKVTPEYLVEKARDKTSVFHDYFEWSDKVAAHNHRLDEARYLLRHIEIKVISNGETRVTRAYEVVSHKDSGEYKKVQDLSNHEMNFVINTMISDLSRIKGKCANYNFDSAVEYIAATIQYLENSKEESPSSEETSVGKLRKAV